MNKHIRLVQNTAIITATDDFEPLYKLSLLEIELRETKFKGDVVFDLLFTNGLCENRFIEISFNGNSFNKQSFKVTKIDKELRTFQNHYFSSRPKLLEKSVLSTDEIHCFIKKNLTRHLKQGLT